MRQIGQTDVFGDPDVQNFLKAALVRSNGRPPIEIYSLSVGPDVIATFAGVCDDERFSAMFNSIEPDRFQTESPGEQSLFHLVKHCCERGLKTFDLGIGEARYKNLFCQDDEPVFDTLLAQTPAAGSMSPRRASRMAQSAGSNRARRFGVRSREFGAFGWLAGPLGGSSFCPTDQDADVGKPG